MGGFGESSTATTGGGEAASGGSTAAASEGLSASGVLSAIGLGLTAYQMIESERSNRKQLKAIKRQQAINTQRKRNLLEERLAARRARVGSMGISSDGSVAASNRKLADDVINDIAADDEAFNTQYSEVYDNYREKLRKNLIDGGMNLANKVLK